VDKLGEQNPEGFAGVSMDNAAGMFNIYVVDGFKALAADLVAASGGYGRIVYVQRSLATLGVVIDSIATNMSWVTGLGLKPSLFGADVKTNTVYLNVPQFTPAQEQAVKARFGQYVELRAVVENFEPN
jgi:hypothetical protein